MCSGEQDSPVCAQAYKCTTDLSGGYTQELISVYESEIKYIQRVPYLASIRLLKDIIYLSTTIQRSWALSRTVHSRWLHVDRILPSSRHTFTQCLASLPLLAHIAVCLVAVNCGYLFTWHSTFLTDTIIMTNFILVTCQVSLLRYVLKSSSI